MNIVTETHDYGVSQVHDGHHFEGLKAMRASMKAMMLYIGQRQRLGNQQEKRREQELFQAFIESDESIRSARLHMQTSTLFAASTAPTAASPAPNTLSFMHNKLFLISEIKDIQTLPDEMIFAIMLYNTGIGAHLGNSLNNAAICYSKACKILSGIDASIPSTRYNEITHAIRMICLNNVADIERESGNYLKMKVFLEDMNEVAALSQCATESREVQSIESNLLLNSLVYLNLSTAGAA